MSTTSNEEKRNPSLLRKQRTERRTLIDDTRPLSLIIMDLSPLNTILSKIDKRNELKSTITKMLKDNTRKTDITTCTNKSIFALFLPDTLESDACTLSDRLFEKIKKVQSTNNFNIIKGNHILFQISTCFKSPQDESELRVIKKELKYIYEQSANQNA